MKPKKIDIKLKLDLLIKRGTINQKLIKIIHSDLFWILFVSGVGRLFYYSLLLNTQDNDSSSYLNFPFNILKGETNGFRTPVYPYFIKFIGLFNQHNIVNNVIVAQCIISFLSIIIFYNISRNVFRTRLMTLICCFIYGLMLPIINFDKIIRTESLAVFSIVVFLALMVSYFKKATAIKATLISLCVFLEVMLRPSFIVLLPIIIAIWGFRYLIISEERKICLSGLVSSAVVILLIIGYSNLNKKNIGFNGISTVTNINQLDILIYANMYSRGNDPELTEAINENLKLPEPFGGHWNLLKNITQKYEPKRIAEFISNCRRNQPGMYIGRIYHTATSLETENIFTIYATHKKNALADIVRGVEKFLFCITFNIAYIFLVISAVLTFIIFFRFKNIVWSALFLWLVIVGQIAVAIIGAQGEYQRLIVTTLPCFLILLFWYLDRLYLSIDMHRLRNCISGD